jgi:3-methyladenine DNA glycosylase AlkC
MCAKDNRDKRSTVARYAVAKIKTAARKGAASTSAVSKELRAQLNAGIIETKTLSEGLVVDFALLANNVGLGAIASLETGVVKRMKTVGEHMVGVRKGWRDFISHPSDTVRGWSAFAIAAERNMSLPQRLRAMKPLAGDAHFGVREWAWLALRDRVAAELDVALVELLPWVTNGDPNLRRFASEITRPCGVWCAHIAEFKSNPVRALPLLEPLRADVSRYVQNSVANWLNDASKTQPTWVKTLTTRWSRESKSPHTAYIVKRATRTMTKVKAAR